MSADLPVVVLISRSTCPYCIEFEPMWNTLSDDPELFNKFHFVKLDVPRGDAIPEYFGKIKSVPTIIVVKAQDYNDGVDRAPLPSYLYDQPRSYQGIKNWLLGNYLHFV